MKEHLLCMCLGLLVVAGCQSSAGPVAEPGGRPATIPARDGEGRDLSYSYLYNHEMPPDYIARTGLAPSPSQPTAPFGLAWMKGLLSPSVEKTVEAAGGSEMRHRQAVALTEKVGALASQLVAQGREHIDTEDALTVSTFVNLNDLYRTSSLGRFLGEQLIGSLRREGYGVIEVRKPAAILVQERFGEYGLSRDMGELAFVHQAQAMVVGTYAPSAGQVFVNVRLMRGSDGFVLAAASMVLEEDEVVAGLLRDEAAPLASQRSSVVGVTGR